MSKQTKEPATKQSPELVELTTSGTVTLTAGTREELAARFEALKAEAQGVSLMTGAAGRNNDGIHTLRVDIIKQN